MTVAILIDTDILIDASRKVDLAVDFIAVQERGSVPGISLITKLELLAGCRDKRELQVAERFLRRFVAVGLDGRVGDIAADLFRRYRLSHGLMIPDCLIAATALALEVPLATKNCRDFVFIAELELSPYGQTA
ncbi:type II toxin-antitoxin system VapC family toxin [uncultured Thiodictyon sp.]|uniref:type II toxin-antitoxin system VapC family toxin n=1 Tax=uncultured Thiodictyon sp. TaxID=1846217 RepID=UPI0025EE0FD0|nr:type II toxin-antitoxin system VapC family toxin [uncultured Thiodictyon sp.]